MRRNGSGSTNRKKHGHDLILVGILLAAAAVLAVLPFLFSAEDEARSVRVRSEDTSTYYSLESDRKIRLESDKGINIIEIKGGKVSMTDADCPDLICVRHKAISKEEDGAIICLPHKVIVEIVSGERN